jgi:uncharacterized repeat protein (TIGR01451 family)
MTSLLSKQSQFAAISSGLLARIGLARSVAIAITICFTLFFLAPPAFAQVPTLASEIVVGRSNANEGQMRWAVYRFNSTSNDYELVGPEQGLVWGDNRNTSDLAIGDINGDGQNEIVVGRSNANEGQMRWAVYRFNSTSNDYELVGPEQATEWGNNRNTSALAIGDRCGDRDDDGLLDCWETDGLDSDGDGAMDVDLASMGADPLRKDLFLEIDCLVSDGNNDGDLSDATDHSHCPLKDAVEDVVRSFANAPVTNLDKTEGIQLHIDTGTLYGSGNVISINGTGGVTGNYGDLGEGGDQIPEAGNTIIDWDGADGDPATNFYTLKQANFLPERQLIFRYSLFAHQTNARKAANDCTSGWAEGTPGSDFMVTLGGVGTGGGTCWGTDTNGFSIGIRAEQAGTLMHELGHVIGLNHGGEDSVNYKPNYLSVMNYTFQTCNVPMQPGILPGQCDYSRDAISLNESSLDECLGFDNGLYGFGSADWNNNSNIEGVTNCNPPNNSNVSVDINGDSNVALLTGFDDWDNIAYKFRNLANAADGIAQPVSDEADPETIEQSRRILSERLRPILQLEKTGPNEAIIGETVTYTLRVKNIGYGPALNVVLEDLFPDGSATSFELGILTVGSEAVRTVEFTIPLNTQNGTTVTNTVTANYQDIVGNEGSIKDTFNTRVIPKFEYTTKVVCGLQRDRKDTRHTPGLYATAINVHNPNYIDVPFFKKLALAFPSSREDQTRIFPISTDVLKPDEAATIDCMEIEKKLFPSGLPASYVEGFVVLQSRSSLDVDAVYTTASLDGWGKAIKHSSIDVERIPERNVKAVLPDLVPIAALPTPSPNEEGLPGFFYCVLPTPQGGASRAIRVTVRNQGSATANSSITEANFFLLGEKVLMETPSLEPGEEVTLDFEIPQGCYGSGFSGSCRFRLTVDAGDQGGVVTEANEDNNVVESRCLAPAG